MCDDYELPKESDGLVKYVTADLRGVVFSMEPVYCDTESIIYGDMVSMKPGPVFGVSCHSYSTAYDPKYAIVLRGSFSNPMWWGFHRYLMWMHHSQGNTRDTVHSHDARLDLTLRDMRIEPAASRDPFKFELSEDQKAMREKGKPS